MRGRVFLTVLLATFLGCTAFLVAIPGLAQVLVRGTLLLAAITANEVRVTHSGNQTFVDGAGGDAAVTFDTDVDANASMHSTSTNPTRLTIPAGASCVIAGNLIFTTSTPPSAANSVYIQVRVNGTTAIGQVNVLSTGANVNNYITISTTIKKFGTTDYVELFIQNRLGQTVTVAQGTGASPIFGAYCTS